MLGVIGGADDAVSAIYSFDLMQKYADQRVSFTDCVSFVLMKKYRVGTAFSFDRHFEMAGFAVEPR